MPAEEIHEESCGVEHEAGGEAVVEAGDRPAHHRHPACLQCRLSTNAKLLTELLILFNHNTIIRLTGVDGENPRTCERSVVVLPAVSPVEWSRPGVSTILLRVSRNMVSRQRRMFRRESVTTT